MRLVAGLSAGVVAYVAFGMAVGIEPRWLRPKHPVPSRFPLPSRFPVQLRRLSESVVCGAIVGFTAVALSGVAIVGVVAGAVAGMVPRWLRSHRARSARAEVLAAWPDAIRDVVTNVRASMSLHGSLVELGRTGPVPLRPTFERYASLAVALDQARALEVVRDELADPLSDRVFEVFLVALDQGSSVVVDILEALAASSTSDLQLVEAIETAQLETKLEARGASVMPFVVLGLLCSSSVGYRDFYGTAGGWFVVTVGAAMVTLGLIVIERLGSVTDEARILGGDTR